MMKGLIFDVKEFALGDGEGIRTTVFFKGCPLRCVWCHNPEGLSPQKELYERRHGCLECGLCRVPCKHADCQPYGRCLHVCPMDLLREVGREYSDGALAEKLLSRRAILEASGGGVTFSGGEPLLQAEFCIALAQRLRGKLHLALETCGYAAHDVFVKTALLFDFVMMDLKLMDEEAHLRYTGVSNRQILKNAAWLMESGIPFLFRTPLIPGITDTRENLAAVAAFAKEARVELLPYNTLAAAKYGAVHRTYTLPTDEQSAAAPDLSLFQNAVLRKK